MRFFQIHRLHPDLAEYLPCVRELFSDRAVLSMDEYLSHGNITTLEHSIYVSFLSFLVCRRLGLDYRAAARGGLLHDFYLYDWHDNTHPRWHGFKHAAYALKNAEQRFALTKKERDIIRKHMFPLNLSPPHCLESLIVNCVDKYCAFAETVLTFHRQAIKGTTTSILGRCFAQL